MIGQDVYPLASKVRSMTAILLSAAPAPVERARGCRPGRTDGSIAHVQTNDYDYDYDRKVYHIDFPFTSHGRKPSK